QGWRAVFGAVGSFVCVEEVAPDHHFANVGVLLASVAGSGERVARVTDRKEIQELKHGIEKAERQQDEVQAGAPRTGRLSGIAVGAADVIERAVARELRSQQVELGIFRQGG